MARKSFKKHAIKNDSCSSGEYLMLHREPPLFLSPKLFQIVAINKMLV